MLKETVISHLIKPEDIQHHGTLFAGRMAEWLVETCFIAACRLVGKPEDIVCVQVHGIHFKKPATNGDIIEIKARIAFLGAKSITVHADAFTNEDKIPSVTGMATFVTVDKHGKAYAHGLSLSEEYIAQNREIYEEAGKVRASKQPLKPGHEI
jgi:acyl-CoA hydrolase